MARLAERTPDHRHHAAGVQGEVVRRPGIAPSTAGAPPADAGLRPGQRAAGAA